MIVSHRIALSLVGQEQPDPWLDKSDTAMTRMLRPKASETREQIAGLAKGTRSLRDALRRAALPIVRAPTSAVSRQGLPAAPGISERLASLGGGVMRGGPIRPNPPPASRLAAGGLAAVPGSLAPKQNLSAQKPSHLRIQAIAGLPGAAPLRSLDRMTRATASSNVLSLPTGALPAGAPVRSSRPKSDGTPVLGVGRTTDAARRAATDKPGTLLQVSSSARRRDLAAAATAPRDAGSLPPLSRSARAPVAASGRQSAQHWEGGRAPGLAEHRVTAGALAARAALSGAVAASTCSTGLSGSRTSDTTIAGRSSIDAGGASIAGTGRQGDLQRQVIPPAAMARRSAGTASPSPARADETYQPPGSPGIRADQGNGQGTAAGASMVVNLTGNVVIDGRRLGLLTAASQARDASLPAHGQSRVNLRAVPIYSGAQIPR